ncbi:hypothetical protein MF672_018280 [Actinomadura sp. ATCC 31491]|uniref:STAS domain-containing protein n=1 Tax=Actinomadura luzonensis TaxID=2805427 RepID=A0ABT0FTR5_9ACTN|nr:hypothetical protein [Actinomadura luzonensis]MCK2215724.1 hypothetical protein [Actinomadura luzonensis]
MTPEPARETPARVRPWLCGTIVVLDLAGTMAGPGATLLRQGLATALARRDPPFVVLDATRAGAFDADGLVLIASAGRHAREAGGRLLVTGWPESAGPLDGAEIRPTLEAALTELARTKL